MIGFIAVIVFSVVSALGIFNTIQMAIFNRRDEIQIMRLWAPAVVISADRYCREHHLRCYIGVISVLIIRHVCSQ